jgi:hypothetical protein
MDKEIYSDNEVEYESSSFSPSYNNDEDTNMNSDNESTNTVSLSSSQTSLTNLKNEEEAKEEEAKEEKVMHVETHAPTPLLDELMNDDVFLNEILEETKAKKVSHEGEIPVRNVGSLDEATIVIAQTFDFKDEDDLYHVEGSELDRTTFLRNVDIDADLSLGKCVERDGLVNLTLTQTKKCLGTILGKFLKYQEYVSIINYHPILFHPNHFEQIDFYRCTNHLPDPFHSIALWIDCMLKFNKYESDPFVRICCKRIITPEDKQDTTGFNNFGLPTKIESKLENAYIFILYRLMQFHAEECIPISTSLTTMIFNCVKYIQEMIANETETLEQFKIDPELYLFVPYALQVVTLVEKSRKAQSTTEEATTVTAT